ncbi:hypothetical protein SADUNF_Sadunf16G0027000 [Salix dunnii]|uniref:Chromo domain-containing protein n=1 Tax=Salix dunnii TaxID=1413687 RepID=A0A835J4P8_9ROSI|nr:hypothetical protein SADUNF_Sadunf16G0027000 [Salix dunnii]
MFSANVAEFKGLVNNESATQAPPVAPTPRVPTNTKPRDEIAAILDHQFVSTRRGGYYKFLVQWKNRPQSESVWLQAAEIQRLHPHLFAAYTNRNLTESSSSGGVAVDANQEEDETLAIQEADDANQENNIQEADDANQENNAP